MQGLILLPPTFPSNAIIQKEKDKKKYLKLKTLRFGPNPTHVLKRIDLSTFLPESGQHFYRYLGSLTTPDCKEVVEWTIIRDPIYVRPSLIQKFRQVSRSNHRRIGENYRPIQDRGDRIVKYLVKK